MEWGWGAQSDLSGSLAWWWGEQRGRGKIGRERESRKEKGGEGESKGGREMRRGRGQLFNYVGTDVKTKMTEATGWKDTLPKVQ